MTNIARDAFSAGQNPWPFLIYSLSVIALLATILLAANARESTRIICRLYCAHQNPTASALTDLRDRYETHS